MNNKNVISLLELKVLWLYSHPGVMLVDRDTYYWYDDQDGSFFWQNPCSKHHNSVYPANGLNEHLRLALKKWAD